jgi:single-strand DNA-binding protein
MALNLCQFMGNLGEAPVLKALPTGESVVNFSIACTDRWKDKTTGEQKESTEWIRAVCFGKRGEVIAEHFTKGSAIYISGKLRTRSWDKDGVKHYMTEIVVTDFQFCGKRDNSESKADQQAKSYADTMPPMPDFDDDIPF